MMKLVVAVVAMFAIAGAVVPGQHPNSSGCCSMYREHFHRSRFCQLESNDWTCGSTFNKNCHDWNDHGVQSGGLISNEMLAEMAKEPGCKDAYLEWQCSTWCGTCRTAENGTWYWQGGCGTTCDKMLAACAIVRTNPMFSSQFLCNASLLPADPATGLCHIVTARGISANELGWGILGMFIVIFTVFTVAGIFYEHYVVPWYNVRAAAGKPLIYKP